MTDSGPDSTKDGAYGRDDPRWSSSLSNSDFGPGEATGAEPPNPFSREGARASEAVGVDASIGGATAPTSPTPVEPTLAPSADERWPGYPPDQPSYGSNPYAVDPYQLNYGGYSPYGAVPTTHPKATTAMVLGIISIVLASSCGVGGLLGIAGIMQGRKVRDEIDARPGVYAGRSMATAGIITGWIGVVLGSLVVLFVVLVLLVGAGN